jgi:hypothetical protein
MEHQEGLEEADVAGKHVRTQAQTLRVKGRGRLT